MFYDKELGMSLKSQTLSLSEYIGQAVNSVMEYNRFRYFRGESELDTNTCSNCCCPLNGSSGGSGGGSGRRNNQVRYNSAFRLCYSLQLLPCYNEKHQLITISPLPHSQHCCKMRRNQHKQQQQPQHNGITTASTTNTTTSHLDLHNHNYSYNNNTTRSRENNGSGGGTAAGGGVVPNVNTSQTYSILWLPVILATALLGLYAVYWVFRDAVGNSQQVKFPSSIEDIQNMMEFLLSAKKSHPYHLLLLFSYAYVFKQSFAVPGSVFLNLLAGALFGPYYGFVLTCTLTAIGASCCFLLSRTFGMAYVIRFFPDRVRYFQEKVESNKDSLFFFLLFLRLFPMSPNWAINMICPIVGVPLHLFFPSVFIGLMPYNFICVQTGDVLSQISSVGDVLDLWTMAKMAAVALVALMPGIAIKWFKVKQD